MTSTVTKTTETPAQLIRRALRHERRNLLFRRISRNQLLVSGGVIFAFMLLAALVVPIFLGQDPYSVDPANRLQTPGGIHILGTDTFGRDLLSRILAGGRSSLLIGCLVAVFSSALGLVLGLYSAFYRRTGAILMRIVDGLMAFPAILLAIAIMAALGAKTSNVIVALTVVFTPHVARVVRAAALVVKTQTYVEALNALGAGPTRILWLTVVPNLMSPLVVQATFIFADSLIVEAALSFVGAGVPAPAPSWGNILYEGKTVIYNGWWMTVFPGLAIMLTVLSINLLGDGLRDLLDPRQVVTR
ncbi:MAG TPA: ABC transporter permease [Pseudonocardia sp.]|jgi:peptide/nickel transport system permease protein|uniref:ABC transporter permease n=1 Tax=Pseudonocardia sp. TaxID=60912 RepID=UPI002EDA67F2